MKITKILKSKKTACGLALIWVLLAGTGLVSAQEDKAKAPEKVLATADGIQVTSEDMQFMKNYYDSMNIVFSQEKYVAAALELKLYAREAMNENLGREKDIENAQSDIEKQMILAGLYIEKMLREYPVAEPVIESYYLTHSDKFTEWSDEASGYVPRPLDDEVKENIRSVVLSAKKGLIQEEAYERLSKKYNARICDIEKGCGEV